MATDARIRENLAQLTDVTKVVIAQRVASVMDADQIVVLEDGRVHATGTHEELLQTDDIYRELYESQVGGTAETSAVVSAAGPAAPTGPTAPASTPATTRKEVTDAR